MRRTLFALLVLALLGCYQDRTVSLDPRLARTIVPKDSTWSARHISAR